MRSKFLSIWFALALSLVAGCTGLPDGTEPVRGFHLEAYLGTWYEVARLDHSFERGLECVTADYSRRDDGGVRVINRGIDRETGELRQAEGRAYFVDQPNIGHLKVSFFGPVFSSYVILDLDKDYQWALVSGYNRDYLWLLSRRPEPGQSIVRNMTEEAENLGFPVDELIFVDQGETCTHGKEEENAES